MKFFTCISIILLHSVFAMAQEVEKASAMFHGPETHTGVYPGKRFKGFGELRWTVKTGGKVFSSPAMAKGTLFIGSEDAHLYAIEAASGKVRWKFRTDGPVHSSPAVHEGIVYFGSMDGYYYAVDASTGKQIWRFKTGGEKFFGAKGYWDLKPVDQYHADPWQYFLSSPVVGNINKEVAVYFGSSDGKVYAVDAVSGELKWSFLTNGPVHSSPALYAGKLYIGSWDAALYALDATTGNLLWKYQTGQNTGMTGIQATPAIAYNTVFIGARDAKFYALDAASGKKKWEYDARNSWILSTAAVKDNTVYFGTSDSFLFVALDASTGHENFTVKANGYVYSSPALVGNMAYYGDFTGKVFAVDVLQKGKLKREYVLESRKRLSDSILVGDTLNFQHASMGKDVSLYKELKAAAEVFYGLGSILSSPVVYDGTLYFGSADGNVYAVGLAEAAADDRSGR